MGTAGLDRAVARGAPLAEILVRFRTSVDPASATATFNALGEDIDLNPGNWYDDSHLRVGSATKEALERLFGWRLIRVPVDFSPAGTPSAVETPADGYCWAELEGPQRYPASVADLIESIGITQPGADDDGQWYE